MKVLFLDIDGVLNSNGTIRAFGFDFIDPHLVDLVGVIVDQTDAKIVLSSTWRLSPEDKKLVEDALTRAGLSLMDCTPNLCGNGKWVSRSEEIKKWLSENPVDKFAILDDFEDAEIPGSFFKTDDDVGLTKAIALEVIKHLNS